MSELLGRRCALVLLAAMSLALLAGLLAWGPIGIDVPDHAYADQRRWFGVPNAGNVLSCLPLLFASAWGWLAARRSHWPAPLRRAWTGFHACAMAAAAIAALYHLAPGDTGYMLAHATSSGAFVLLAAGVLAERVDERFAAPAALALAGLVTLAALLWVAHSLWSDATMDLRPLLLLQMLPVLLIPAGAISLPGAHTRSLDWIVMLGLYALARLFDLGDAAILQASDWIAGHTLMHLSVAGVAAWLAYRAGAAASASSLTSRPQTSLNASG